MPESDPLHSDATLLCEAVREAGALALKLFRQNVRRWSKTDGSPVSEADVEVDRLLRNRLQGCRPSHGWLSEETGDNGDRLRCEKTWIVDPIDGTRAFIKGSSEWCIAAALVSDGRPTAAAIYRPMHEEFYSAVLSGGARLNEERIACADAATLEKAKVAGTRKSLAGLVDLGILADVSGSLPLQLRLAMVASGRLDAAVSFGNKNDWDLAAGDLIVREAGGIPSDLSGHGFIYNRPEPWQQGLIAAGKMRHAAITRAVASA